jgi:hypothetical protein
MFLDAWTRILAETTIMLTEFYGFLCIGRQMSGFHLNMAINCLLQSIQHGTEYMRENQQMHQLLFNLLVMYGGFYMFRHCIAILRERS